jgi:hypothetical protein
MLDMYRCHIDTFANADAVAGFLEGWLQGTGARVDGALLSTAWKEPPDAEGGTFLLGRLLLLEEIRVPRKARRYPSVRLDEAWIDRDKILTFVRDAAGGNKSDLIPDVFHAASAERLFSLHSHDLQSGWAEIQLKLTSRSNRVTPEWIPAVAPSLPPYQSWAQAAATWVLNLSVIYGAEVPYSGQLVVVLPDTQARPGTLSAGPDGKILISTDSNDALLDLELQYIFSRSRVQLDQGSVEFRGRGQIAIPLCSDATRLDVYCLHRESGIVSHRAYSWDELRAAGSASDIEDADILSALADGETDAVEFKPFVSLDSDKRREIVRTVVAFANGNGGRIFVGVDDQGEPEGRGALRRFRSTEDPLGLETVLGQLTKLIHDHIKPVPIVAVHAHEVAGEPIGIIEVPPGDLVYATHDNDILIRKGSTNRRPDPASELGPLLARRRASSSDSTVDDVF